MTNFFIRLVVRTDALCACKSSFLRVLQFLFSFAHAFTPLLSSPLCTQNVHSMDLLATGTDKISVSQLVCSKGAFCWSDCNAVIFTFPSLREGNLFSPNLFCEAFCKGTKGFRPPVLSLLEDVERNESWHYFLQQ